MESISVRHSATFATRPLVLVVAAIALGIVADRHLGEYLGSHGLLAWWALGTLGIVVGYRLLQRGPSTQSALAVLLSFAALAGAWHHLRWNYLEQDHLARYASHDVQPTCVRGVVRERVRWTPAPPANPLSVVPKSSQSIVQLEITAIRNRDQWQEAEGQCQLRVAGELSDIQRGNLVQVFGQVSRPRPALNPGQYEWAAAERGAGRFVEVSCRVPRCVSVVASSSWSLYSLLDRASWWCESQISRYVGDSNRDLALALMLGQRERLPEDQFESFLRTGTVHLLVVSGLHVGFLAWLLWWMVRSGTLSARMALTCSAVLIVGYALVVGARPPVQRATILVLVAMLAVLLGRGSPRANILAAAALVVFALNPSELFRGGTQLSFLCVGAIAWYMGREERARRSDPLAEMIEVYKKWPRKLLDSTLRWMVRLFQVSLVIWLVTVPLVTYHFNMAAPVSVLLTPLIWPLVACALICEFVLCLVGWLLPPVAYALGSTISLCLSATNGLVGWADSIELGHYFTVGPSVWWLCGLYVVLGMLALPVARRINWKWQAALVALWISIGFGAAAQRAPADQLRCTFLAIGHGTCVVLELPGGQTVLYDAGSLGSPEWASRTIASFLWSRGISTIDAVVLSHADIDHYNAVPGLIERFTIGATYVSPLMFDPWATRGRLTAPNYLRQTLLEEGVPLQEVWMNDQLRLARRDLKIDFLHPPRTGVAGRDNANSLLMRIRYAGHTILLPGDLESPGIEAVMAEPAMDCDILLAPHHGSVRSDPPGFAAWCRPKWVVVSGRDTTENDFTADSYRNVGAQVLHTSHSGAVSFQIEPQEFAVTKFRAE